MSEPRQPAHEAALRATGGHRESLLTAGDQAIELPPADQGQRFPHGRPRRDTRSNQISTGHQRWRIDLGPRSAALCGKPGGRSRAPLGPGRAGSEQIGQERGMGMSHRGLELRPGKLVEPVEAAEFRESHVEPGDRLGLLV